MKPNTGSIQVALTLAMQALENPDAPKGEALNAVKCCLDDIAVHLHQKKEEAIANTMKLPYVQSREQAIAYLQKFSPHVFEI